MKTAKSNDDEERALDDVGGSYSGVAVRDDTDENSSTSLSRLARGSLRSSVGAGVPHETNIEALAAKSRLMALLIVLVGAAASAGFLYLGITKAKEDQADAFDLAAKDMALEIETSWQSYETAGKWIHESCREWRTDGKTQKDFDLLYNYLVSGGLEFFGAEWIPNITHDERAAMEEEGRRVWADRIVNGTTNETLQTLDFKGLEPNNATGELEMTQPRSEQPFYFPIKFAVEYEVTEVLHYDVYSAPWERAALETALQTWSPQLTEKFLNVMHTQEDGYSVALYHPGARVSEGEFKDVKPRDLSNMIIHVNSFLASAAKSQSTTLAVYLYDSTNNPQADYLAGMQVHHRTTSPLVETNYTDLQDSYEGIHHLEQALEIGTRTWQIVIVQVDGTYEPQLGFIVFSGVMILLASVLLAVWMLHNTQRTIEMHRVVSKAAAEASIVRNMFPSDVRKRMILDAQAMATRRLGTEKSSLQRNASVKLPNSQENVPMSSEEIFGSKPIAELHPYTTIMFADLVGFTPWSSVREPSVVFQLLETIYHSYDNIAKRLQVEKVETVGDCYVAVAGLPEPRKDHAVVMAKFASDCSSNMQKLAKALEKTLGPDTGDLGIRIGLHSGQCTAGVLRGKKGRFQLFGDSVNMASSMESTGKRNKIQVSPETAELLKSAGHGNWLVPRPEMVYVKGYGELQTSFLQLNAEPEASSQEEETIEKTERLVEWNVQVLSSLLKAIIARRGSTKTLNVAEETSLTIPSAGGTMVLDEVKEIIALPGFQDGMMQSQIEPDSISLDTAVVEQLRRLVSRIAAGYRENPFHSFEHASHVTMSVIKMMTRIVNPKEIAAKRKDSNCDQNKLDAELHQNTFGVASDPLTQFACAFSALIHDLDHQGVTNTILIGEGSPLAEKYQNKSVAEQNSVDLAWGMLMGDEYEKLRNCICSTNEEFTRFRQLVVNSVMATDIMDKQLGAARKARWNKAFAEGDTAAASKEAEEGEQMKINRKATIVIEHLIQASDISHTMQHWHIYVKWNERLFHEMYKAYKAGRLEKDPSLGWHQGEIGFFDFYIIPLAKKLFTCGVFGVSSDEFLNYAVINRKEWEKKGGHMVQQYLKNYEALYGGGQIDESVRITEAADGSFSKLPSLLDS